MKKLLSLLLVAWLAPGLMSAQTYVVEGLYRDCAKAHEHTPGKSLLSRINPFNAFKGEKEIMLPNGTEVTLLSDKAYRMVSVEYEGETWYMDSRELRFADSNPAGMEDVLADADFSPFPLTMTLKNGDQHPINRMEPGTAEWKVLHSRALPIALGVLMAGLLLILLAANDARERLALWVAPLVMLALAALEVWYVARMGRESYWWCSLYYYPKWGAGLRWILFALAVAVQWTAYILYYRRLRRANPDRRIGGRWWMLLATVVAVLVGSLVANALHPEADTTMEWQAVQAAWRSWAIWAVGLSLVFPVIYMCVKTRSPQGILAGVAAWAFPVATLAVSVLFIGATWAMIKVVLVPLLSLLALVLIIAFMYKFKPVTVRTTGWEIGPDGERRYVTRQTETLEFDPDASLFKAPKKEDKK